MIQVSPLGSSVLFSNVSAGRSLFQSGEALSPEREPLEVLDALKLQIGSDAFSGSVSTSAGAARWGHGERGWIVRYSDLPPVSDRLRR
jgi:hypothetical protein